MIPAPAPKLKVVARSFFDREAVISAMSDSTRSVLSKVGAFIRQRAKSSIRKARQKSLSEMTPDELLAYRIRVDRAKRDGEPRPKRPLASSRPGEPPRSRLGYLRKYLFFAWDATTKSLVVGPARFNGAKGIAPTTLEYGGTVTIGNRRVRIQPRPYMRPAFEAEQKQLPQRWAEAAAKFGKGGRT